MAKTAKIRRAKFKIVDDNLPLDDVHLIRATDLVKMTKVIIKQHGKNVFLRFDAGWENILVIALRPTRGRGILLNLDGPTYKLGQ